MFLLNAVQNNEEVIKELKKQVEKSDGLVKDMEQKVISLQDHQISFLNDSISNFWTVTSVAIAVVAIIITGVSLFIGYLNRKAQKKMEDAEKVIGKAKNYISEFSKEKVELAKSRKDLEDYRKETKEFRIETEKRFTELTEFVKEIDKLKEDTQILFLKHQISIVLQEITNMINWGDKAFEILKAHKATEAKEANEYKNLREKYMMIEQEALAAIAGKLANDDSNNPLKMKEIYQRGEAYKAKCITIVANLDKLAREHLPLIIT
ncbi:hypothetical protein [Priestia megaterium]|uniref:hypothetical protein n=1 Tax=Priestia megaterium TaxID=1404 RepID=UPI0015B1D6AC|nr:hypothetical protein [Priestia megaterium]QLC85421.1 hypothetical protein HW576_02325 [Priestia megaterium]